MVFLEILSNVACLCRCLHAAHQPVVERLSRVDPRIAKQMVQRDDFSNYRDVFPRIEKDRDLRQFYFQYGGGLDVEAGPFHDGVLIPFFELDDNFDAFLLADSADPEYGGEIDLDPAPTFPVVALHFVEPDDHTIPTLPAVHDAVIIPL